MNTADEFMDDLKTHAAFKSYEALMSCRAIEPEVDALADTGKGCYILHIVYEFLT